MAEKTTSNILSHIGSQAPLGINGAKLSTDSIVNRSVAGSNVYNRSAKLNAAPWAKTTLYSDAVDNVGSLKGAGAIGGVLDYMTFSRASTATYTDASGTVQTALANVPRIDYSGGVCQGLLIEDSATNLLTYSDQFDNAAWTKTSSTVTTNVAIAPNGTQTADSLNIIGNGGTLRYSNITVTPNTSYSFIIFVFGVTRNTGLYMVETVGGSALSSVSILSTNNGVWTKYSLLLTTGSAVTQIRIQIGDGQTVSGDVVTIWGAQLEAGTKATSYIPTTSAAVTRAADTLYISNANNWFNTNNGTLQLTHDAPSGTAILGDTSNTLLTSQGPGTINVDFTNGQLAVISQTSQASQTMGIFNFDSNLYIMGTSTVKANSHLRSIKFFPTDVNSSTPAGSGLIIDTGYALMQEDGNPIYAE